MIKQDHLKMLSDNGIPAPIGSGGEQSYVDDLGEDLSALLLEQRRQEATNRERELNLYRCGSAPPTVEGSLTAFGGLFGSVGESTVSEHSKNNGFLSEEELKSDPAYLSYYYSHANLNPRLPPPILTKEDWRLSQRLQAGNIGLGGIGDRRKLNNNNYSNNRVDDGGNSSLFSLQPGFHSSKEESEMDVRKSQGNEQFEKRNEPLIALSRLGVGARQKSYAEIFQDELGGTAPVSTYPSLSASRNALDESIKMWSSAEAQLTHFQHEIASGTNAQTMGGSVQGNGGLKSHSLARASSPCLQLRIEKKTMNGSSSFKGSESVDLLTALSGMNLSANGVVDEPNHLKSQIQQEIEEHQNFLFDLQANQNHIKQPSYVQNKSNVAALDHKNSPFLVDGPTLSSAKSYPKVSSSRCANSWVPPRYQNVDNVDPLIANYSLGGYSNNPLLPSIIASQLETGSMAPFFENAAAASSITGPILDSRTLAGGLPLGSNLIGAEADMQNFNRMGNQSGAALQMPPVDPLYLQYLRSTEYAAKVSASFSNPSLEQNYMGNSYVDLLGLQKAYLGELLSPHKSEYGVPFTGKSGGLDQGYYLNPAYGLGMPYPGSPVLPESPVGPGSPIRHHERNIHFVSGLGCFGRALGSWHSDSGGNMDMGFLPSMMEGFKCSKTKSFELLNIAGHVVEFSADQYGSRFIQQKLETATIEEKNMVFQEIIPQARSLMTDVFGNYVIQKFFEHGTAAQRRELANMLNGHVLTLSLQMYGCRVIQKAIEVVDLDQQTKMVAELDGHVMRCVRDQNGNHVIQKCIECIPPDAIQFIISSFYEQVVTLSTHPYGCRVIQRVLEHCNDPKTQDIMMEEILRSACMLAQDQYGNYVVQHVLQHGKPHERSSIIKKLAGQIVQMSQQKFASNVVEKCLAFGGPAECEILVNEMLGTTDENEPLQAMMKDQFANYVVQKVLETCDDQQRELILSRIKVHLNALKKYTYGKHIVARVEKLVAAGERRVGLQAACPSS